MEMNLLHVSVSGLSSIRVLSSHMDLDVITTLKNPPEFYTLCNWNASETKGQGSYFFYSKILKKMSNNKAICPFIIAL